MGLLKQSCQGLGNMNPRGEYLPIPPNLRLAPFKSLIVKQIQTTRKLLHECASKSWLGHFPFLKCGIRGVNAWGQVILYLEKQNLAQKFHVLHKMP